MDHHERACSDEFQGEVAIRYRVETVSSNPFEFQFSRNGFAIDRETCPGQRGGTERENVDALADIAESLAIASNISKYARHQCAQSTAAPLQVRVTGQHRICVSFGSGDQSPLKTSDRTIDVIDLFAEPQPESGRDLIVATSTGVQFLPVSPISSTSFDSMNE
jgi:hypothetical protein